jgi:hypothetical protein
MACSCLREEPLEVCEAAMAAFAKRAGVENGCPRFDFAEMSQQSNFESRDGVERARRRLASDPSR